MKAEVVGSNLGDLARAASQRDTPSHVIDELVSHEGDHERKDNEGFGVFGLLLVSVIQQVYTLSQNHIEVFEREIEIVAGAFYRPIGDRSPEAMVSIASGPGFSEMSDQDWNVYNSAKADEARLMSREEKKDPGDGSTDETDEKQDFSPRSTGTIFPQPMEQTDYQQDYSSLPLAA